MEITGKIIAVLEPRKGTSNRTGNEWICGQYVLETMDQYPRKLFFEVFGADRMQQFNIQLGEIMTVSFDIDAREYQGRWYNDVRAWKVEPATAPTQLLSVVLLFPLRLLPLLLARRLPLLLLLMEKICRSDFLSKLVFVN